MRDHDFLFRGSGDSGQLLIELKGVSKSLDEKLILHSLNVQIPRNRIIR